MPLDGHQAILRRLDPDFWRPDGQPFGPVEIIPDHKLVHGLLSATLFRGSGQGGTTKGHPDLAPRGAGRYAHHVTDYWGGRSQTGIDGAGPRIGGDLHGNIKLQFNKDIPIVVGKDLTVFTRLTVFKQGYWANGIFGCASDAHTVPVFYGEGNGSRTGSNNPILLLPSSTTLSFGAPALPCPGMLSVAVVIRWGVDARVFMGGTRTHRQTHTRSLAADTYIRVPFRYWDDGQAYEAVPHGMYVWDYALPDDLAAEVTFEPYGMFRPLAEIVVGSRVPVGGATIAAGLATETDSAFGIGWTKRRAVGLVAESDAALAATARRIQALGLAAESDAALAAGHARAQAIGLAAETDTAPAATARRTHAAGLAAETDTAPAAGHAKAATAGQAAESDAALPVSAGAGVPVGQAAEIDTAPAAGHARAFGLGLAAETDSAFAATAIRLRLVGLAAESDAPQAIVVVRRRAVGLAGESDAALAVSIRRAVAAGLAAETDTAPAIGAAKAKLLGLAVETDSVLALVIVSDIPAREQVMAALAAELAAIAGVAGLTVERARTLDLLETELPVLVLFDDDERLTFETTGERRAALTIRIEGFAGAATPLAAQQAATALRAALDRKLSEPAVMFAPAGKAMRGLRRLAESRPARLRPPGGDPAAGFVRAVVVEYATPVADPYTLV